MTEKEIKEFMEKFVKHGMGCGEQIGNILQKDYPKALVLPLYRSAVAIEYDEEERVIRLHCAGDPHVWGKDLIKDNIEEDTYVISGNRFGPILYQILFDKALLMKHE